MHRSRSGMQRLGRLEDVAGRGQSALAGLRAGATPWEPSLGVSPEAVGCSREASLPPPPPLPQAQPNTCLGLLLLRNSHLGGRCVEDGGAGDRLEVAGGWRGGQPAGKVVQDEGLAPLGERVLHSNTQLGQGVGGGWR